MAGVELQHLDGAAALAQFDDIQAVYAAAFPDHDLADHRLRTERQMQVAGFDAVAAREEGRLVGFVYGLPLSSPRWWEGLEPQAPAGFTTETGDRTVAVIDLAVLPSHRGQGLARRLMEEFLRARREARATLATSTGDTDLHRMYERWGWSKIGRVPGSEGETQPAYDLYVITLR